MKVQDENWYTCDIPRKELKTYMERADWPAVSHIGLWLLLLVASGVAATWLWDQASLWAIPVFLLYGILWATSKPVSHETGHGTAFRTPWLNTAVYFVAAAMEQKDMVSNRWQHARHHSETCMVGRDYEIITPKPPKLWENLLDFFYLKSGPLQFWSLLVHSLGVTTQKDRDLIPPDEMRAVHWGARVVLLLHLIPVGFAIVFQTWLPVVLFVLPQFYGSVFQYAFSMAQHPGLEYNVLDHRLDSRTIYMNPLMDWMTLHMQYHVEHHLYPTVPFWQLKKLHGRVKDQLPPPYRSLTAVFAEMIPELLRELKNPASGIRRPLPVRGPVNPGVET